MALGAPYPHHSVKRSCTLTHTELEGSNPSLIRRYLLGPPPSDTLVSIDNCKDSQGGSPVVKILIRTRVSARSTSSVFGHGRSWGHPRTAGQRNGSRLCRGPDLSIAFRSCGKLSGILPSVIEPTPDSRGTLSAGLHKIEFCRKIPIFRNRELRNVSWIPPWSGRESQAEFDVGAQ